MIVNMESLNWGVRGLGMVVIGNDIVLMSWRDCFLVIEDKSKDKCIIL
jgi:hypothetical protein